MDDHSSDDSWSIISTFAEKDARISMVKNRGEGIIMALQTALDQSTGSFITRMDADDIMPTDKLEKMFKVLKSMENTVHTVVTGKVQYFSLAKISDGYLAYEQWLNERIDQNDHWAWMYRECTIASANWMTHRSNIVFEKDVYPEDYNLVFHWYKRDLEVIGIDAVTHFWREHEKRTSRTSNHYAQEAFFKLKLTKFIALNRHTTRPLAVMGKNKKAKLVGDFLSANNIDFTVIDLENLHRVAELHQPQVLVAVFPNEVVRDGIVGFLAGFGLNMGEDWWWV